MKTLTIEHLSGYAPFGLKVLHGDFVMTVQWLMRYGCAADYDCDNSRETVMYEMVKPVLVPLDKLTDAQYAEVGRMVQNDSEYAKNWLSLGGYLGALNFEEAAQVLQYLHSLRCDIYGLIPAGLAISAYDLPENPYKES